MTAVKYRHLHLAVTSSLLAMMAILDYFHPPLGRILRLSTIAVYGLLVLSLWRTWRTKPE